MNAPVTLKLLFFLLRTGAESLLFLLYLFQVRVSYVIQNVCNLRDNIFVFGSFTGMNFTILLFEI